MKLVLFVVLIAIALLAPTPPFALEAGEPFEPPSLRHPFGTDDLGRDLAIGVIQGARLSLLVGVGTVCLALVLGGVIGIAAGWLGGVWDEALMRIVEVFQIVPRFFLALVVLTIWGYDVWRLVLVLALTSWSGLARLARAETLSIKQLDFVVSVQASGAKFTWLFVRHLLQHAARPLVATAPLATSGAMLTEAGLSFLGLGSLEHVSWGYLLQNAQPFLMDAWWMALFPGLAMTATVFGMAMLTFVSEGEVVPALRTLRS